MLRKFYALFVVSILIFGCKSGGEQNTGDDFKVPVITSYSIHYTKLYDDIGAVLVDDGVTERIVGPLVGGVAVVPRIVAVIIVHAGQMPEHRRIAHGGVVVGGIRLIVSFPVAIVCQHTGIHAVRNNFV